MNFQLFKFLFLFIHLWVKLGPRFEQKHESKVAVSDTELSAMSLL